MKRLTFALALALALAPLAACNFDPPMNIADAGGGDDVPEPDARIDAMPGDPCLTWNYDPSGFDPCAIAQPIEPGPIDLPAGTWTLDSGTGVLSNGAGTDIPLAHTTVNGVGVVSVDHLVIPSGAILRGVGPMPLAIAVWNAASIDGVVDVSSSVAGGLGAGASSPACPSDTTGPQRGLPDPGGDGAGGGGGFGEVGGQGGDGAGASVGGTGGASRPIPARVEGGCAGAAGAEGADGTPGSGGAGGGAVYIAARTALTIAGSVHAGGAGGGGGSAGKTGGGGGGSGGMIVVEAADLTLTASAILAANGGQGGGGCDGGTGLPGEDGLADDAQASSMNHDAGGGDGGVGGFVGSPVGGPGEDVGKGGGGAGGAVGYIAYRGHGSADVANATMSPAGTPF